MQSHPAAALFPMMTEAELRQLADDIREHGLTDAIVMLDGMILDGRNRFEACKRASVEPRFDHPENIESPTVYVVSKNLHRRHLTVSQRAAIGAEMMPLLREEAKQRQVAGAALGGRVKNHPEECLIPKSAEGTLDRNLGQTRHVAGRAVGVGHTTITTAANIKKADPVEFERVKAGIVTLENARRKVAREPVKGADPSKMRLVVKDANKRRMEEGLSMVRGACRGLSALNLAGIKDVCTEDDLATWAKVANDCAKQLREFARKISDGQITEVKAG